MSNQNSGSTWHTAKLGEVAQIIRGISFPTTVKAFEPKPGHVACLRTSNVQRDVEWGNLWFIPEQYVKRSDQLLSVDDILISTANSYELVGKVALVRHLPQKATLGAFIAAIRPSHDMLPKFLYYQLCSTEKQQALRKTASTTTNISNISTAKVLDLELGIASQQDQAKIVSKIEELFSDLDAGVAALKRAQANLKRYRAAVLKAAVEGRLTAQWRAERKAKGIATEPAIKLLERILAERRKNGKPRNSRNTLTPARRRRRGGRVNILNLLHRMLTICRNCRTAGVGPCLIRSVRRLPMASMFSLDT